MQYFEFENFAKKELLCNNLDYITTAVIWNFSFLII